MKGKKRTKEIVAVKRMPELTESAIGKFAIELLTKQDFEYVCGPDIAPDSDMTGPGTLIPVGLKKMKK